MDEIETHAETPCLSRAGKCGYTGSMNLGGGGMDQSRQMRKQLLRWGAGLMVLLGTSSCGSGIRFTEPLQPVRVPVVWGGFYMVANPNNPVVPENRLQANFEEDVETSLNEIEVSSLSLGEGWESKTSNDSLLGLVSCFSVPIGAELYSSFALRIQAEFIPGPSALPGSSGVSAEVSDSTGLFAAFSPPIELNDINSFSAEWTGINSDWSSRLIPSIAQSSSITLNRLLCVLLRNTDANSTNGAKLSVTRVEWVLYP